MPRSTCLIAQQGPTRQIGLRPAKRLGACGWAALILAGCGGGTAPVQPEEDDISATVSLHTGSYACGAAKWAIRMQIAAMSDGDALGTATIMSMVPPEKVVIWGMAGTIGADGTLKLAPKDKIDVPLGFNIYGFEGKVSDAGFEGTTTNPSCGPVKLERFAKAPGSPLGE